MPQFRLFLSPEVKLKVGIQDEFRPGPSKNSFNQKAAMEKLPVDLWKSVVLYHADGKSLGALMLVNKFFYKEIRYVRPIQSILFHEPNNFVLKISLKIVGS